MPDARRVALIACVMLVVLRISIGWQLLYEGLWKINSRNTAQPWSAKGYLVNAQGPFRPVFRNMAGDPDDLDWLDYDKVAARWDRWHKLFLSHYPNLTDEQKQRLNDLINGPEEFTEPLERLPEDYKFSAALTEKIEFWGKQRQVIRFDEDNKQLVLDGKLLLLPNERDALLRSVKVKKDPAPNERAESEVVQAFREAVKRLYDRSRNSAKQTYKIRLRALLKGDPDRAGLVLKNKAGDVDEVRMGDIELYRKSLERYEKYLANAKQDFEHKHLQKMKLDIRELKSRVVGPVKSLDVELQRQANYQLKGQKIPPLLTEDQMKYGPSPIPTSKIDGVNALTMWSLTVLGVLLIAGLFTRFAAVAGAGMLLSFYLVSPPWPGVPELPGPEHSLIVNKNFIEALALLAIAVLPTGIWFGVDGMFRRAFRSPSSRSVPKPAVETPKPPVSSNDPDDIFREALERMKAGSGLEV
ncbi:MAG: DoxX family protein [Planctomycetes bacterium]|nr:DoxX family protein [Planctomycetota bacterium]